MDYQYPDEYDLMEYEDPKFKKKEKKPKLIQVDFYPDGRVIKKYDNGISSIKQHKTLTPNERLLELIKRRGNTKWELIA